MKTNERFTNMAVTTHHSSTAGSLGAWAHQIVETLRLRLEQRRLYRRTLAELSGLSNRELADLGLHRSELRRVAYQAAYDHNARLDRQR